MISPQAKRLKDTLKTLGVSARVRTRRYARTENGVRYYEYDNAEAVVELNAEQRQAVVEAGGRIVGRHNDLCLVEM